MIIFILASVILSIIGLDLSSSMGAVAACLANIGPGLGTTGPMTNYSEVPVLGKWVLSIVMLLGRLRTIYDPYSLLPNILEKINFHFVSPLLQLRFVIVKYRIVINIIGFLLILNGLFILTGIGFSIYYQSDDISALLISGIGTSLFGLILMVCNKKMLKLQN